MTGWLLGVMLMTALTVAFFKEPIYRIAEMLTK